MNLLMPNDVKAIDTGVMSSIGCPSATPPAHRSVHSLCLSLVYTPFAERYRSVVAASVVSDVSNACGAEVG